MNRGFWLGVYPGLTEPMVRYIGETITEFCQRT
jgi:dTDP-4-amino-4,6-dideoxygalactose transaminase